MPRIAQTRRGTWYGPNYCGKRCCLVRPNGAWRHMGTANCVVVGSDSNWNSPWHALHCQWSFAFITTIVGVRCYAAVVTDRPVGFWRFGAGSRWQHGGNTRVTAGLRSVEIWPAGDLVLRGRGLQEGR